MQPDLLTAVFNKIRPRLMATARRLSPCEDDARDALQEAFARLWVRRERYTDAAHVEGAMMLTVQNLAVDNRRDLERNPVDRRAEMPPDADAPDAADDDTADTVARVMQIIESRLSPRLRRVLYLRDKCEWEMAEIAADVGATEANVRQMLARARRTVREIYREYPTTQPPSTPRR